MAKTSKSGRGFSEPNLALRWSRACECVRSRFTPRLRVLLAFPEGSGRTRQSFAAECDINNIMARFSRTGVLDFTNRREAQYGDVTGLDYQRAMDIVVEAKTLFAELPSAIRSRFSNEPAEFLEFVQDPANVDEMVKMGLAKPRPMEGAQPPGAGPEAPAVAPVKAQEASGGRGQGGGNPPPAKPGSTASGES